MGDGVDDEGVVVGDPTGDGDDSSLKNIQIKRTEAANNKNTVVILRAVCAMSFSHLEKLVQSQMYQDPALGGRLKNRMVRDYKINKPCCQDFTP